MPHERSARDRAARFREERLSQVVSILYDVSRLLAREEDLKRGVHAIFHLLASYMGMRRGTLVLLDPETRCLSVEAAYGPPDGGGKRAKIPIDEGPLGRVFRAGIPMVIPREGEEALSLKAAGGPAEIRRGEVSYLCVPVRIQNQVVGVLSVDRVFSEGVSLDEDLRLLSVVATLLGQAMVAGRLLDREREGLVEGGLYQRKDLVERFHLENIVGASRAMEEVFRTVARVARSRATVLLRGESGTGKELIARSIHTASPRRERPFVKVHCAALPETLLESELFGHEKGAFTGATAQRIGRFELADGGTLFLDEVGDLPLPVQVKLLRVIQERKFERLGSSKTLSVDVRLIAATHQDLERRIQTGEFREDLYYRLNVVPLFLPPLRDRREDIPALIEHFLEKVNRENGTRVTLSRPALEKMVRYAWPGNVRELENTVERMVVLSASDVLREEDLPLPIRLGAATGAPSEGPAGGGVGTLPRAIEEIERKRIEEALREAGGVQSKAARALGFTARQLGYRLKKYSLTSGG